MANHIVDSLMRFRCATMCRNLHRLADEAGRITAVDVGEASLPVRLLEGDLQVLLSQVFQLLIADCVICLNTKFGCMVVWHSERVWACQ